MAAAGGGGGGRPPRCLLSRDRPRDRLRDAEEEAGLRPWPTAPPPRLAMLLLRYICEAAAAGPSLWLQLEWWCSASAIAASGRRPSSPSSARRHTKGSRPSRLLLLERFSLGPRCGWESIGGT